MFQRLNYDIISIRYKIKGKERLNESIVKSIQLKISKIRASVNNNKTKLQDDAYLARYAKEKYMLSSEGDTIIKILNSN